MQVDLIDFSSDNGTLDYQTIVDNMTADASGAKHVCLRTTMGVNGVDSAIVDNAKGFTAAGAGVSYYHLGYPSTRYTVNNSVEDNAILAANSFCKQISSLPAPEMVWIDLENVNIPDLNPSDYQLWVTTWLERVATLLNVVPGIYSPAYWLNAHLPSGHGLGAKYKLWLPNYNHVTNPPLPSGWDSFFLWQYGSTGNIAGTPNHVDISVLNDGCTIPS